jgi:putative tryptophan/tyrosine transport system substrate-binding protein
MKRREVITLLGGAAAAWPLAAHAQQAAVPVIGLVNAGSREASAFRVAAFRKGLSETGYVEGQNVAVEYHWFSGQYDQLPTLMADLVRRRVAIIATPGGTLAASAAKAATTTIPIVFGVAEDPVKLGLVSSLARPGGNATGINIFLWEVAAKRLGLLHELAPRAGRVAVVINPGNVPSAEATLRDLPEAARAIGLQIQILNASTSGEIEAAFATLARDRAARTYAAFQNLDGWSDDHTRIIRMRDRCASCPVSQFIAKPMVSKMNTEVRPTRTKVSIRSERTIRADLS